ncbi:MAG TPA: hypothetical protein VKS21_07125, partial [Spirochaetota bacterium]|nr:hypothetical protein [Spirochaetota bacterium]
EAAFNCNRRLLQLRPQPSYRRRCAVLQFLLNPYQNLPRLLTRKPSVTNQDPEILWQLALSHIHNHEETRARFYLNLLKLNDGWFVPAVQAGEYLYRCANNKTNLIRVHKTLLELAADNTAFRPLYISNYLERSLPLWKDYDCFYRGYSYLFKGETNKAEKYFLKELNRSQSLTNAGAVYRVLDYYEKKSNFTLLTNRLTGMVHRRSENNFARYQLISVMLKAGWTNAAAGEFNRLLLSLTNNSSNFFLLLQTAALSRQFNRTKTAEKLLLQLIKKFPDRARPYNFLGYLYAERNIKLNRAEILLQKALELKPDQASFLDSMAWLKFRQKQYQAAEKYIRKAVYLSRYNDTAAAEIYFHAGEIALARQKYRTAKYNWQKSLQYGFPDRQMLEKKLNKKYNNFK